MRLPIWAVYPNGCSTITSKVWWCGVTLRKWCIGIRAFWTLRMWQDFPRKRGLPYRPQTKGKVENGVKYVRGNFWPGLHFRDLDDLNDQALAWLNTTANPRVHGTTGEVPFSRLRAEGLQPAEKAFTYDTSILTSRRSSKDCVISYEGNLYSVPAAYARQTHEAQNHRSRGTGDLL